MHNISLVARCSREESWRVCVGQSCELFSKIRAEVETWAYLMSTVSATVAFLLLLDTTLLSQAGITHYSQQLTLQHSTKLLFVFFFLFIFKLIIKVLTTTWRVPPGHFLTNFNYKLIIRCQYRQEMGKIPNFTDSKRLKTPKMDCALKVYQDKEFYQLGFQVCWP